MKTYKPTTPSRRNMSTTTFKGKLTSRTPHKSLTKGGKRGVGRNNAGRITMRASSGAAASTRWSSARVTRTSRS